MHTYKCLCPETSNVTAEQPTPGSMYKALTGTHRQSCMPVHTVTLMRAMLLLLWSLLLMKCGSMSMHVLRVMWCGHGASCSSSSC